MRSKKNLAILFLSLTTLTAAGIAWQQYQELSKLRSTVETVAESAEGLQPTIQPMDAGPVSVPTPLQGSLEDPSGESAADTAPGGPSRPTRRNGPGNFAAMMDRPEVQRLMALQQKAALDSRYAALFKNLKLSPEQLEQFKDLLVEKSTAVMDVMAASREQGLNPRRDREAFAKSVANAQAEVDENIRATLGETAFAQYENFEKTMPQRQVVNQLEQRLSYSSTPLTAQQSDQLVGILATTTKPATGSTASSAPLRVAFGGSPAAMGPGSSASSSITDATINQALGVLAAPQIEALRQLQQEQQAQAALNAEMRNRFQGNTTTTGDAPTAGAPTRTGPTSPPAGG